MSRVLQDALLVKKYKKLISVEQNFHLKCKPEKDLIETITGPIKIDMFMSNIFSPIILCTENNF